MSLENNIPNGWVETTLREVCEVKGGKRLPKGEALIIEKTNHPYIRITDFEGNSISKSNLLFVPNDTFEKISRYIVNKNDIIISIVGTIGLVAKIYAFLDNASLTENCNKLVNLKGIKGDFLYYYLISRTGQYQININTVGAVQKKLPIYGVQNIKISYPKNIEEQKAIANILRAFDDKIENLQAQNQTLEKTAQTIFKKWFGKYQINDELPEGWRVGKLGEVAKLKSGYAFKSKDFVEKSDYKALKIKDLKGQGNVSVSDISSVDKECTKIDRVQFFRLKEGDIVLAMSGNTTGKIGVLPPHSTELYLNQRVGKFFLNDENFKSFLYNFLMSGNFEDKILSMGYGSAQPNISPSQIENIDIIFPNEEKQSVFLKLSNPIYDKVLMNNSQIQSLKKTRDSLLPKLMSGQIRVKAFKS